MVNGEKYIRVFVIIYTFFPVVASFTYDDISHS